MSRFAKNQNGFAIIEAVLIGLVLVVIGFVAYKVSNRSAQNSATTTSTVAGEIKLPTKIKSKSDVSSTIKALDSTPINGKLDPSQLDSSLAKLL